MKNKILLLAMAVILVAGLVVAGCPAPAPAPAPAEPIKLILASFAGPVGTGAEIEKGWVEELEEKSGGRVKVEFAYGSVMGKPAEHFDLAVTGVTDISYCGIAYTPGQFQLASVPNLPLAQMSNTVLCRAYWELYQRGYFDEEFKNVKVLWLQAVVPQHLHMTREPVHTFDDLKGKKLRAGGGIYTEVVEALGAVPVGMPGPEVYIAMEKGIVDGALTTWDFMIGYGTHEITKYLVELGVTGFAFAQVMNKASYARLPADIRAIIDEISPKYVDVSGKVHDEWELKAKALFKEAGGQTIHLPEEELEKVWDVLAPIWDEWIAEREAKGLPVRKMVDDLYYILKDMGVEKPYHGYAP